MSTISSYTRLLEADPEVFTNHHYSMQFQKRTSRQPMVITMDLYRLKREELLNIVNNDSISIVEREVAQYKLDIYNCGLEYRNHYYFCPQGYDYVNENILTPTEIEKSDPTLIYKSTEWLKYAKLTTGYNYKLPAVYACSVSPTSLPSTKQPLRNFVQETITQFGLDPNQSIIEQLQSRNLICYD